MLFNKVSQLSADADIVRAVVRGPATGPGSLIDIDGFPIKSLARLQHDISEEVGFKVNPRTYGAKFDGITIDDDAWTTAIVICENSGATLEIGSGHTVLSKKLVITKSFSIISDASAFMRWTSSNPNNVGWDFSFGPDNALIKIQLPNLFGPGVNSSLEIPGYSEEAGWNYDLASRIGDAIHIKSGNRLKVYAQYVCGFDAAANVQASSAGMAANIDIDINTIDFCVKGFTASITALNASTISEVTFRANTIWAKYPIHLDSTNGYILGLNAKIEGGAYVNEAGGCVVYGLGSKIQGPTIFVNRAVAGRSFDSPAGTLVSMMCPFLGGNALSNGISTDGNTTVGYWAGQFGEIDISPMTGLFEGDIAAGKPVPSAGDVIRIRDAGLHNNVRVLRSDFTRNSPIALTATQGEANYNGGVGGAQYSRRVYCSADIPTLPTLNGAKFYLYHQLIAAGTNRPIKVFARDSGIMNANLAVVAYAEANAVNRQIGVEFKNMSTTTPLSARTVYFWIEL